jgi:5-bromo-4-chloroindolyl phosphate hydrolysis protein
MDKTYLRTQINWMDNIRLRLDWYYAGATAFFKESGLTDEQIKEIETNIYNAEESINKAIEILEKAIGVNPYAEED